MQQPEETAAKTETEGLRDLGFVAQRRVVELQLLQRFAQRLILVRFHRIQPGEYLRLDFLEARQGLARRSFEQRHRIADLGGLQFLDPRDDVPDFASAQGVAGYRLGSKHSDLFAEVR
ncbi:MAG: hypothetical protein AW09_001151 [Candidatus Accumulibacter phosphatis]|uniref:Uncharacterized protein n=1 Tax=Candidatus Accumulibacter phosphatis TaxID=327160 RepID=A0A080LXT7_9PROT|nr:MAG: hypothetical protein AW09_001151 [Candidatus Accumulibacter phosphatis]